MPDGSVILVEIERGTLSRVHNGSVEVIAELGGGPNGAAIGPDGHCYVCNNGGFDWLERGGWRRIWRVFKVTLVLLVLLIGVGVIYLFEIAN